MSSNNRRVSHLPTVTERVNISDNAKNVHRMFNKTSFVLKLGHIIGSPHVLYPVCLNTLKLFLLANKVVLQDLNLVPYRIAALGLTLWLRTAEKSSNRSNVLI